MTGPAPPSRLRTAGSCGWCVETPDSATAVEELGELTIPPLAAPKPGRFYLSPRHPGAAGPKRRGLFSEQSQQLSGRKIYPHHRGLESLSVSKLRDAFRYRPPVVDVTTTRTRPLKDSQNATLHSWVRPGARFRFVLQVTDLHPLELGALLWLLDPARAGSADGPARHRIGMGKPLGFGSAELAVDSDGTWFCTGEAMRDRLLMLEPQPDRADPAGLAETFEATMTPGFAPVLVAVRFGLTGFPGRPTVSYPRMNGVRAPGYAWFVQNEKERAPKWLPGLGAEPLTEYDADLRGHI